MMEYEVVIIGGGPAGSTAAWKLIETVIDVALREKCSSSFFQRFTLLKETLHFHSNYSKITPSKLFVLILIIN